MLVGTRELKDYRFAPVSASLSKWAVMRVGVLGPQTRTAARVISSQPDRRAGYDLGFICREALFPQ